MTAPAHTPTTTVCIPVRNQERYLGDALRSALSQSVHDYEVVVFDDASTDGTAEVVRSYTDPRLRYYRQRRRVGIARNRNSCLDVARGRFIAWLDADDVYRPEMLAIQVSVLGRHPRVGLVHGNHDVLGVDGRRLPDWEPPFATNTVESGSDAFGELVLSNYVTAPTVVVRRECYDAVGGYAHELALSGEDWELWMRVALRYDVAYTAAKVAAYRVHDGSTSAAVVSSGARLLLDRTAIRRIFVCERNIADRRRALRRARAALAFKALIQAGNDFTGGDDRRALASCGEAFRAFRRLGQSPRAPRLIESIARRDEYGTYVHSKALLRLLHGEFCDSRFGNRVQKLAIVDPEWEATMRAAAQRVRACVPRDAAVAAVDKHDPTLLHFANRRGWHFPDRRLLPGGYPKDGGEAVEHLEALRSRGAEYLVLPGHALWWLEHYAALGEHLDRSCRETWSDESCRIYQLAEPAAAI